MRGVRLVGEGPFIQTPLRLSAAVLAEADALRGSVGLPGVSPTRTDVLRAAILIGLDALQRRAKATPTLRRRGAT